MGLYTPPGDAYLLTPPATERAGSIPPPTADPTMSLRVRFAPSPTGYLHVGGGAHRPVQLVSRAQAGRRVHPADRRTRTGRDRVTR